MGGGTYEKTLFGILGLHGSAVDFLYGVLFRSEGCYLGSIVITDRAVAAIVSLNCSCFL